MSIYNNILVAIDLNEETHKVALKAHQIGQQTGAKMTLIHVTEPLSYAYGGDVPMDLSAIQQQLHDHAQQRMDDFIQLHQLSDVDQLLNK